MAKLYLPQDFNADPVKVARRLLGAVLRRVLPDGRVLSGRVVETEAYDCPRDPSCAAGRYHLIKSEALAAPPGEFVFWVAYGHPLLQVACRPEGVAASVLIRALQPLEGLDAMLESRPVVSARNLTTGPAKLVQALALSPEVFRGQPVNSPALHLQRMPALSSEQVGVSARVGIAAGRNLPWRFYERGSAWLSGGVPSMAGVGEP